jgi:hypothetical protein
MYILSVPIGLTVGKQPARELLHATAVVGARPTPGTPVANHKDPHPPTTMFDNAPLSTISCWYELFLNEFISKLWVVILI